MRSKLTQKSLIISAVILLAGVTIAFANGGRWGGGYGRNLDCPYGYGMGPGMMGYGMGPGMMNDDGGRGYGPDLTEEQRTQLNQVRDKFFDDTRGLRDKIRDQRYELGKLLAGENPDKDKVLKAQKALSQLEGEFDLKALEHQLEVRKILPDNANQYGRGNGRGYGRGKGPGFGGGYCWR